jgi:aryl-alcohol dehydrogenase-like predicted oxidoreductase
MNYRLLGRSGLRVSELCLGAGTFGTNWGPIGSNKEESLKIYNAYLEAGGNFIDTSNRYQEGMSEELIGEFMRPHRDKIVLATKYSLFDGGADFTNPNGSGNHRKNLMRSVENSLKRLKTDFIDLLWIHIWDYTTPIDECMRALDDLVRQGKLLYVGASNLPAWLIAQGNTMADFHGWSPFIATQLEWSIVERSGEPEFLPMAHALDIGLVCWSALCGGMVTGKYNRKGLPEGQPHRLKDEIDPARKHWWGQMAKRDLAIMDEVVKLADEIGKPPVQVSLRFLLQQSELSVPLFSARTVEQLKEDVGCTEWTLTEEQMQRLRKASAPAISSIMPDVGPYPYPMLEYGSPALPEFYSRALLFGGVEYRIQNHRRRFPFNFHPKAK